MSVMSETQVALAGVSPSARYESLIRLADAIRSQPVDGDLFCERVADYKATVHRTTPGDLAARIKAVCAAHGATRLVGTIEGFEDAGLGARDLDALDGVVTGCALGIAETGTIVLDGAEASGRRALTLVPDLHVCVVHEEQIVASVPDAVDRLAEAARAGRPITLVSGPSATSDIELDRVEGVHGPRRLEVLVVAPAPRA